MKNKSFKIKLGLLFLGIIVFLIIFFINRAIINNVRQDAKSQVENIALAYSEVIHKEQGDIPNFISIFLPTINFPFVITFNGEFYGHNDHQIFKNKNDNELNKFIQKFILDNNSKFDPLPIIWNDEIMGKIHYGDPNIILQLTLLPYIEISFIIVFIIFVFWGFKIIRDSEKNLIWAGMARETAHQLGTPISSLYGWMKLLEENSIKKDEIYSSINEDLNRLRDISDRFYKIGTKPKLEKINIILMIHEIKNYFTKRLSKKTLINICYNDDESFFLKGDLILLVWAIENIIKNALDASKIDPLININILKTDKSLIIDFCDNGIGINKSKWKKIFEPGYTSKKKGWGLGLSLTKRIIEDLHNGIISVFKSNHKGTTLRLEFNIN